MQNAMTRSLTVAIGLFVAGGLAACGGDNGTGPDTGLTEEEARLVLQAVSHRAFVGTVSYSPASATGEMVSAATTRSFSFSGTCASGGTTDWSGQVTVTDDGTSVTFDGTLSLTNCASTVEGRTVTITTTPEYNYTIEMNQLSEDEFEWVSSLTGSFDWELPEKSGNCSLDVETEITGTTGGEGTASSSGTVCGREVSSSFSFDVNT